MLKQSLALLSITSFVIMNMNAYAATEIDLSTKDPSILQSFLPSTRFSNATQSDLKSGKTSTDLNGVTHTRFQQFYGGIEVFGADGIVHAAKGRKPISFNAFASAKEGVKLDGVIYADLAKDLGPLPTELDKNNAIQAAKKYYQTNSKDDRSLTVTSVKPLIYIDQTKAKYAYEIDFAVETNATNTKLTAPIFIVDAKTGQVYQESNDIKNLETVSLGGIGGNAKMGKIAYGVTPKQIPNLTAYLPKLTISRSNDLCVIENNEIVVTDFRNGGGIRGDRIIPGETVSFPCVKDPYGLGIYWNQTWALQNDVENEGYSPTNDALFSAMVVDEMYKKWYGEPVLTKEDGSPLKMVMIVHFPDANAGWSSKNQMMIYGTGIYYNPKTNEEKNLFYPLTALDVGAHEISHGFTDQHSGLFNAGQPGGINESFSDMAAQAAELYAEGKPSWKIGHKITRPLINEGGPLRFVDHPERDGISIIDARNYYFGMDVHFSCGVFNRLFYLIATDLERNKTGVPKGHGWDTKKAFDVMVEANKHYWRRISDFDDAACGLVKAVKTYQKKYPGSYKMDTVLKALSEVHVSSPAKLQACIRQAF